MLQAACGTFINGAKKRNGETTSFCTECMTVIANADRKADLKIAEESHVCAPGRQQYIKSLMEKGNKIDLQLVAHKMCVGARLCNTPGRGQPLPK
jgi:hypothetical protein